MKPALTITALAIVLLGGCRNEPAAVTTTPPPGAPAPFVAGTDSWVASSATTKRQYQISVTLPLNYASSGQVYPVVYATDANFHFGTLVETARALRLENLIPDLIIVGIGWPVGHAVNAIAPRSLDLTPTADPAWVEAGRRDWPRNGWPAPEGSGGGPGFLRFIREELIPSIEQKYRTHANDRAYYGFSLGGLFGIYALLNNEGTFQRFILGSPALFWQNRVMFEQERAYATTQKRLPARVFFSVGLDEDATALAELSNQAFVSNLRDFVGVLEQRRYEGLILRAQYFDGERHNSVAGMTMSRGLRFIYEKGNRVVTRPRAR